MISAICDNIILVRAGRVTLVHQIAGIYPALSL